MRCPNCGYVSFDQATECPKCKKGFAVSESNKELEPGEGKKGLLFDDQSESATSPPPEPADTDQWKPSFEPEVEEKKQEPVKEVELPGGKKEDLLFDDQSEFTTSPPPEPVDTDEWKLSFEPEIKESKPEPVKEIDFKTEELLKPWRPTITQVKAVRPGAGVLIRSLALLFDLLCLNLASILLISLGILIVGRDGDLLLSTPLDLIPIMLIPTYLFLLLVNLVYFTIFHATTGQTLGKLIFRLKVVNRNGEGLGYSQSLLRFSGYLLSALPLGLGFIWALLDPDKLTWHDRLADTSVILY
ncbi:MAG: RDD family protein [Deltaproteobacteria bacterium]|nr:MAG: RDD family protein [Deltaproteobacteria bacterium]